MTLFIPLFIIVLIYFSGIAAFAPREKGEYQVQIYRDEKQIKGSPFSIKVGEHEIAHAAKVNISGKTSEAIANEANYFTIDANGAGIITYLSEL